MDKIKIMHIISDTNIGGAGKYLITYCKNRNKNLYDVSVVLPKDSLLIPELKKCDVKIIEINGLKNKSFDIGAIRVLKKIIKEEKPDIVHTHASFSARIAARSYKNCKIVFTRHCDFEPSNIYKYGIIRKLNGFLNKKYVDHIIATSEHAKENLIKQGVDEHLITTILNGVDGFKEISIKDKQSLKKKFGITEDEVVIGYLARLEELKGHKYLFESAKIIKQKNPDFKFKLLIMGSGSYENELKELAKELEIEDEVIFTGFISNVQEMLNIVDVEVNCSYLSETTNLALLEGLSLGIPLIATKIGGLPQIVEDNVNGFLVDKQDSQGLAEAILLLIKDEVRFNNMKIKSKEIFNLKFTSKIFSENIEKIYSDLISDRK